MPFSNCFFIGFYFTLLWERRTQTNAARRITPGGGGAFSWAPSLALARLYRKRASEVGVAFTEKCHFCTDFWCLSLGGYQVCDTPGTSGNKL